jgi:hypothetical protein
MLPSFVHGLPGLNNIQLGWAMALRMVDVSSLAGKRNQSSVMRSVIEALDISTSG